MENGNIYLNKVGQSVTIRQAHECDELYGIVEKKFLTEYKTKPATLRALLFGSETQHSSPRLFVVASEGELVGYVITFDFFQATYITTLNIIKEKQCQGYGSMLLEYVCNDPNRTYILITEVAMSDSELLSDCMRRKLFYLRNGFRAVPIKWRCEEYYRYDVHIKGPDQELGSLLAVLRKGEEIWRTAEISLLRNQGMEEG